MIRSWLRALIPTVLLIAAAAAAQDKSDLMAKVQALHWVRGPTSVPVAGNARLAVPAGYAFLDVADTKTFVELTHNLSDGQEVMIAPEDLGWMAYLRFSPEGYVKDDEKIDAAALLKTLRENADASNEARRQRGWNELHVVDWAVAPAYNPQTKRLEWATLLESDGKRGTNFFTKILGRRGYMSVTLVTAPQDLSASETALNKVLDGFRYNSGETYAEYKPGDKVAEYGLAALVVGGVAAVATKKGFWAVAGGFLAAAWKFIVAACVGAFAWLKSLLKKKDA